jgi:anti-sigma B factor antagonist
MKFKDKIEGKVGILTLKGKLMGPPDTDELHDEVKSLLGGGAKNIVLDMGGVSWLNSMGVGAIMRCYTTVKSHDGELCLARLTEKAHSLFIITQLIKVFKVFETVDEAVSSYN